MVHSSTLTLPVVLLTLSSFLPSIHSLPVSSCSPSAILPRDSETITDHLDAFDDHLDALYDLTPADGDFKAHVMGMQEVLDDIVEEMSQESGIQKRTSGGDAAKEHMEAVEEHLELLMESVMSGGDEELQSDDDSDDVEENGDNKQVKRQQTQPTSEVLFPWTSPTPIPPTHQETAATPFQPPRAQYSAPKHAAFHAAAKRQLDLPLSLPISLPSEIATMIDLPLPTVLGIPGLPLKQKNRRQDTTVVPTVTPTTMASTTVIPTVAPTTMATTVVPVTPITMATTVAPTMTVPETTAAPVPASASASLLKRQDPAPSPTTSPSPTPTPTGSLSSLKTAIDALFALLGV